MAAIELGRHRIRAGDRSPGVTGTLVERRCEQTRKDIVTSLGKRHVDLHRRSPVQLGGAARAGAGPTCQATELGLQQPGLDESIEMECSERPADADGRCRCVAAHGIGRRGDMEVEGTPDRLGERRHVLEPIGQGADSMGPFYRKYALVQGPGERRLAASAATIGHRPPTVRSDRGAGPVLLPGGQVKVVVGLGNPGSQYAGTRHNVGWLVMDRIAERAGWTGKGRQRDASNVVMGRFRSLDLTLVKPLTYMNESGLAVRKVIAREHAPLGDLLVVADDFALPFGKLRFREGGGPGGHNGLRSIIDELGTEKFSRLRIGIGEPDRTATDHVLSRFAPDEQQRLDELLDAASDAVEAWARDGTEQGRQPVQHVRAPTGGRDAAGCPGEVDGPPGPDGIRRTRTGWRRIRPSGSDD